MSERQNNHGPEWLASQEEFNNFAKKVSRTHKIEKQEIFARRRVLAGTLVAVGIFAAVHAGMGREEIDRRHEEISSSNKIDLNISKVKAQKPVGKVEQKAPITDEQAAIMGAGIDIDGGSAGPNPISAEEAARNVYGNQENLVKPEGTEKIMEIGNMDDEERASFERRDPEWNRK
ncbi:hypothetical protein COY62_01205 [bacterium (Candidatus Howlettbacteria) CG_4_10_14_0_8_um_filter_40_9]|nr:MAG: hypothetical protein COY62_01205 [bacterium (Candidatus Howlettbacteria) CG_4_10_14_0_8_um_filter_40_9]